MPHHDHTIEALVEQAVKQAYATWSASHPSLAAVLNRLALQERTATSLRESDAYHQAIDAYQDARNETKLLGQLLDLAGTILPTLLAG